MVAGAIFKGPYPAAAASFERQGTVTALRKTDSISYGSNRGRRRRSQNAGDMGVSKNRSGPSILKGTGNYSHVRTFPILVCRHVSKNNGTPKLSILIGVSIIFTIHFEVPLFLETPIWTVGKRNSSMTPFWQYIYKCPKWSNTSQKLKCRLI